MLSYIIFNSLSRIFINLLLGLSEESTPICNEQNMSTSSEADHSPSPTSDPGTVENTLFDLEKDYSEETVVETEATPVFLILDNETAPVEVSIPKINKQIEDLIDISPPNQSSPDIIVNDDFSAFSAPMSTGDFSNSSTFNGDHIELIDPFASLATSRNSQIMDEESDNPLLLNFGPIK